MTILITGSTGKTARRLALQLRDKHAVLIAGRSGNGLEDIPGVKFDWTDVATHEHPFAHAQAQKSPIRAVYLVPPSDTRGGLPLMQPFIDTARSKGVQRFVLLSEATTDADSPHNGAVHKYLRDSGVEYAVLRATWFMENFSELQHHETILHQSTIYSATGNGRLPFVSADDIAAVAAVALTQEQSFDRDFIITGAEWWTYDEAAKLFSEVLGRDVHHQKLSETQLCDAMKGAGLPAEIASMLAGLDAAIAAGDEGEKTDDVQQVTGRAPITLRAFVEKNKAVWMQS